MVLVEFSTSRKFERLGVLFAQNHTNRTKIWTLKSRSSLLSVRSKNWTARCEHRDRLNFIFSANAWLHRCVVTQLEKERKSANRYYEHGFTSCVITRFAWKYYGSTVPCEQRKSGSLQPVENSASTMRTWPEANKTFGHRPNDAPAKVLFTYLCSGCAALIFYYLWKQIRTFYIFVRNV